MNINKIKKISELLKYGDGKFLVVEDGEPAFVVMGIEQFKKMKRDEEDYDFDPEEYMRGFDWDDDRYDIDRRSIFEEDYNEDYDHDEELNKIFSAEEDDYYSEEDEEGFSSDDIPFEEFLGRESEKKNKNDIVIEPIANGGSLKDKMRGERQGIDLSDIPF